MEADATIQEELTEEDADYVAAMKLEISDEEDGTSTGRESPLNKKRRESPPTNQSEEYEITDDKNIKRRSKYNIYYKPPPNAECLYGFDDITFDPVYGPNVETKIENIGEYGPDIESQALPPRKSSRLSEEKSDSVPDTAVKVSSVPLVSPPTMSPSTNKSKPIKVELYRKPFEYGWKRELVYRFNPESSKEKADVYFIAPTGKKLRSKNDIIPLLEGELKIEHFSFAKEPLGVGGDYEIVRSAKPTHRSAPELPSTPTSTSSGKRISKPKVPKGASPPPQGWTPTRALKVQANSSSSSATIGTTAAQRNTPKSSKNKKNSTVENTAGGDPPLNDRTKRHNSSNSHRKRPSTTTASTTAHPVTSSVSSTGSNLGGNQMALKSDLMSVSHLFASDFFRNVAVGYDILVQIMRYLKVHERPRAACVCRIWNLAAKDPTLWQTVRMKNSKVFDWEGFTAALCRGGTTHLDLRKLLIPNPRLGDTWSEFCKHIGSVASMEQIDMCRCSGQVVENLFVTNPNLLVLSALAINDDSMNLINVNNLLKLQELRLRTMEKCELEGSLAPLRSLSELRHLTLSSFRQLGNKEIEVLGELTNLVSLELGECNDFDERFTEDVLPHLTNLERLRLEIGQEQCHTLDILDTVAKMTNLSHLEFVNFDIKPGFDDKMAQCTSLRKLLIIPTYISQSATTNHIVLNAVIRLKHTLQVFTWGVTVELLRVTALYVDQCEDSTRRERRHFDECIPVLKPVPGSTFTDDEDSQPNIGPNAVPQIEILPLDKVEMILGENLLSTKFTIVKVPYHATWKQQLVE